MSNPQLSRLNLYANYLNSPIMSFKYNKVLILGATSGIGWALAEKMVQNGTQVIIVGRRKEKLDEFQKKHGSDKVDTFVFDITKLDAIPQFVKDVTSKHPDLDSVFLNSGIQRGFDFSKPETVDLSLLEEEFKTNYLSYMHLTTAFIPFLQKQKTETSLIYTTSGLALLPLPRCPNYCASKAALHHMILVLREQLKTGPGDIKVIEIFPPAVQTELHDAKHQPDIKDGANIGMPLEEFTDTTWKGLVEGKEQIPVGFVSKAFEAFENKRQEMFHSVMMQMH
jgi:short-subunit dehydrogenase involved in D-alanine esterification of teichoic acids